MTSKPVRDKLLLVPVYLLAELVIALGVIFASIRLFRSKRLTRDAAFLAYFSILSMVPFLSLLTWVAQLVARPLVRDPQRLAQVQAEIVARTGELFPGLAGDLESILSELVSFPDSAGVMGLVAMFITSGLLFSALSVSISEIYGLSRPRGFLAVRLVSAATLVGLGTIAFGLMALREAVTGFIEAHAFPLDHPILITGLGASAMNAVFVVLGFLIAVRVSTVGRMKNRPLVYGGIVFWLAWELAARIFGLYLEHVASLDLVYGSLTTIMVVLIWLFYTSITFLFSVCVASVAADRIFTGGFHQGEG